MALAANSAKAKFRLILALDRFVQARTQEEKVRAAHWVNAWSMLAKAEVGSAALIVKVQQAERAVSP